MSNPNEEKNYLYPGIESDPEGTAGSGKGATGGDEAPVSWYKVKRRLHRSPYRVVRQKTPVQCLAASVQMLLLRLSIDVPQEVLARALQTGQIGAYLKNAPEVINKYIDSSQNGLLISYNRVVLKKPNIEFLKRVTTEQGQSAIVSVEIHRGIYHAIVVDDVDRDWVYIRDPLGAGSSYKIPSDLFGDYWSREIVYKVF